MDLILVVIISVVSIIAYKIGEKINSALDREKTENQKDLQESNLERVVKRDKLLDRGRNAGLDLLNVDDDGFYEAELFTILAERIQALEDQVNSVASNS